MNKDNVLRIHIGKSKKDEKVALWLGTIESLSQDKNTWFSAMMLSFLKNAPINIGKPDETKKYDKTYCAVRISGEGIEAYNKIQELGLKPTTIIKAVLLNSFSEELPDIKNAIALFDNYYESISRKGKKKKPQTSMTVEGNLGETFVSRAELKEQERKEKEDEPPKKKKNMLLSQIE